MSWNFCGAVADGNCSLLGTVEKVWDVRVLENFVVLLSILA